MSLAPVLPLPTVAVRAATLGDLIEDARESLACAVALQGMTTLGRRDAVTVAAGYADLVSGLRALWTALWSGCPAAPEARRLDALLAQVVPTGDEIGAGTAMSCALRTAATAARSAADLLATHRETDGVWRSPESEALADPALVRGSAAEVAHLVVVASSLRAGILQGLRRNEVGCQVTDRLVGPGEELRAAAIGCRRAWRGLDSTLGSLGVARPVVRVDTEPTAQFADRWRRLRRAAWELSTAEAVSMTTLADLATVACLVNRVAVADGLRASASGVWRALRMHLVELRTTALRSATVRSDALIVGMLLAELPRERRRVMVTAAVAGLPQLAAWCGDAFATARACDIVYVDAMRLRGVEVTDQPELAAAKLRRRLVAAPTPRLAAVRALFTQAAARHAALAAPAGRSDAMGRHAEYMET